MSDTCINCGQLVFAREVHHCESDARNHPNSAPIPPYAPSPNCVPVPAPAGPRPLTDVELQALAALVTQETACLQADAAVRSCVQQVPQYIGLGPFAERLEAELRRRGVLR